MSLLTNLISHWKLNEASGTRNDSHSTNHLTDNNTVAATTGKIGDAALFVAANNEWLSITDNAALSTGEVSFGCAIWVNLTTAALQILIGKDGVTSGAREWGIYYDSTASRFKFYTGRAGSAAVDEAVANNFGAPSTGVWYLVTGWFDQPTGTLSIAVNNGTANTAARTGTIPDTASAFQIGRQGSSTSADANAAIDSVSFWKGGYPSAGEWTQLYNSNSGLDYESFGSASGAITGTATLTFGQAGTLNGAGSMAGSTTLTFGQTGTLVGTASLAGNALLTFGQSATLTASGSITGLATLTFLVTGAITGEPAGSISGTTTLTFTVSGTLTGTGTPEPPGPFAACDPNALLAQARCFFCWTEEQRALGILSLWCQISVSGSLPPVVPTGNFMVTESGDGLLTEAGDLMVIE